MGVINTPATYIISNELGRGNELSDQEYHAWLERDPMLPAHRERTITELMSRSPWMEVVCQEFRECAPVLTTELSAANRAKMEQAWAWIVGG